MNTPYHHREWLNRDGFPVKITGYNATTKAHDWTLQIIEPDGSMIADTRTISGSNLFELNGERVPDDSYIFARWAGLDAAGMSVWMCAKGGGNARVRVTGNASGGGKYTGFTVANPATAVVATGNLASADLGTNTTTACLIVNAAEAGQTTHDLTAGTPVQTVFIAASLGMSGDATPIPVYMINGFDLKAGCANG